MILTFGYLGLLQEISNKKKIITKNIRDNLRIIG